MQRQKKITADGSHTILEPDLNVTFHSVYGAVQESRHVYIRSGLHYLLAQGNASSVNILEVGFGTGLNALLTFLEAKEKNLNIHYHAIEPFPLNAAEWTGLNYCALLNCPGSEPEFKQMHRSSCNTALRLSPAFCLYKDLTTVQEFRARQLFHLLYYDAFAPAVQPGLWTTEVFRKLFNCLQPGGVLVTYCSKGAVRRAMTEAGFSVEKIPGPAHKREMIRTVRK
ncbi:tRNA (5-methylaminomethyl-2-thiouridine)(34)-methyltransferase MnmD [Agriterribacter sp.]|uniref:tRNA (5-methylaminomethyl-2-thiouridine)(34)-methyltransferase MnmD n=1 Tax=Agriterribacter sp. TaxID=2821509 RepID=UPI002B89F162|nr:tRNA (5-methylaminomethyl-2-thiouridine)(34)-methyltransferase MnmD [Agriterribacter sp.]HRP55889.1 tRNA (5-methylaminomethyl-2-thiouridine)(34)-methyltransferase MnmD [Agriterribacter sp.]